MSDEATSTVAEAPAAEAAPAAETTLVTAPVTPAATEGEASSDATQTEGTTGSEAEAGGEVAEGEAKPEGEAEAKPEGAPEEYAEFAMPEGITLDPELTDQFKTTAKELNLTQEQAQRVVELGAAMRQRDAEMLVNARAEWVAQSKAQFSEADLATAKHAVDVYGDKDFQTFLNESGLGNHPQWIRFLVNAGKSATEDRVVQGGDSTNTPLRTQAKQLYPNANQE